MKNSDFPAISGLENEVLTAAISKLTSSIQPMMAFEAELKTRLEPIMKMQAAYLETVAQLTKSFDAVLEVISAQEKKTQFLVEVKKDLELRNLSKVLASLSDNSLALDLLKVQPLLVAPYIPASSRKKLKESRVSYADATGNFMFTVPDQIFIESDGGANSDPFRERGRKSNSLKGSAPAKVLSYLVDNKIDFPISLPSLIKEAGSSASTGYRVVEVLTDAGAIAMKEGRVVSVDWEQILELWSDEYSFFGNNKVLNFFDPRGRENTLKNLAKLNPSEYTVTGSYGARNFYSYAPPMQLTMFGRNPLDMARELGLEPFEGGDIYIAATAYDSIFKRSKVIDRVSYASVSQIAIDLLSGPGRNPSEGKELLSWMKKNEEKWRNGNR